MLQNTSVELFSNTIILKCIMCGEFDLCTLRFEIGLKICSSIFSLSVKMKYFYPSIELSFAHCLKYLVSLKHF